MATTAIDEKNVDNSKKLHESRTMELEIAKNALAKNPKS